MNACMGGFRCLKRETCVHHHREDRSNPAERLCEPGQYGAYIAINLHKVEQPKPAQAEPTPA